MNRKLILIVAVVILVVIGVMIRDRGKEEDIPKKITFGEECFIDEDCGGSFKTCRDGIDVSCENGCVYGKCTKCVPVCPGESKCGNETCVDSIRVCPDGRTVRCANYCEEGIEECTSCTPECGLIVQEGINYELKAGNFIIEAIPCIDANYTERKGIKVIKKNLTEMELPDGYSIIMGPFSADHDGTIKMTLNIPETYTDVKVLRCRGDECNSVVTEYVTELRCGGKISKEFLRKRDYLEPRLMPVNITEVSLDVISGQEIRSDKYKVKMGDDFEGLVTLAMPMKGVMEAKNPGLKISGTPLVIKIDGSIKGEVSSVVTMPYTSLEGFEEDSIGLYVKIKNEWDYIGGDIDKEEKTVTATITDIGRYLNDDDEIETALMGILCVSCYGSTLTKIYQPENGGKIAVILVHGFNPEPDTYREFIDDIRLTNQPFDIWTFNYPSSNSVKESSKEFMGLLENNNADYEKIYVVAHSLGGLIAQQALYNSYLENKNSLENQEPYKYSYLDKVKKVVLVGVSNEGSPVVEVYGNLFKNLVNKEKGALFNPKSRLIEDLVKGIITPRVPGIDYKVIAGTKTYGFNLLFFKLTTEKLAELYEKNDGLITVKSAQHIGDKYIDNQCEDYWEMNLTHTELIDDPIARKVIERIISEDVSIDDTAILGHNRYFDLSVEGSSEDTYIVIGKKVKVELLPDETGCGCGNGFCGEGEDEINCPSDCARFLSKKNRSGFFALIAAILVMSFIYFYSINRRASHPHLKSMVSHVKTHYEIVPGKGYTLERIRDAFLSKGWPKRIVNDLIKLLKKEFYHTYRKHLEKSYTKKDIKKALLDSGWSDEAIDKVLKGEKLVPSFELKEEYKPKLKGKRKYFGPN